MFSPADYNYSLPEKLIAQSPAPMREKSRLLVLERKRGTCAHHIFEDLERFLNPRDLLVLNDTKVIPGRLFGKKATGGKVEVLILDFGRDLLKDPKPVYKCLLKSSRPARLGQQIFFNEMVKAQVVKIRDGFYDLRFEGAADFESYLQRQGKMPLPPYIRRSDKEKSQMVDKARYQTVYATQKGAIAAPTAGLHFTPQTLERIEAKGVTIAKITLHVGYGTFLPIRVADIRSHKMHAEWYHISSEVARAVQKTKAAGGRVFAVGTTCVRVLEYVCNQRGELSPGSGWCDLFIYPGYQFKLVDALVTNFHLPRSTLLMLVSAFAGQKRILDAYQLAVEKQYRFFSYGDAMLIL